MAAVVVAAVGRTVARAVAAGLAGEVVPAGRLGELVAGIPVVEGRLVVTAVAALVVEMVPGRTVR